MRGGRLAAVVLAGVLLVAGCEDDAGTTVAGRATSSTVAGGGDSSTSSSTATTAPARPGVVLLPDGLGVAAFGAAKADVEAAITAALGPPDGTGEGCELAGDQVTTTTWKELSVQFADGAFDAYSVRPKMGEPVALGLRTPEGLEVGSTLEEVIDLYGDRVAIPGLPPEFQDPDSFALSFPNSQRKILGGLTGGAIHSTVTGFFTQLCD